MLSGTLPQSVCVVFIKTLFQFVLFQNSLKYFGFKKDKAFLFTILANCIIICKWFDETASGEIFLMQAEPFLRDYPQKRNAFCQRKHQSTL